MVKIEFTPLSLDRKIFPFKKGFKKLNVRLKYGGNTVKYSFLQKIHCDGYLLVVEILIK